MTAHTHACALCRADFACINCDPGNGSAPVRCPSCDAVLSAIDTLPRTQRPRLDERGLKLLLRRVTMRAVESSRSGVDVFSDFCAALEALDPADPDLEDADTWARIGAVQGARDGWLGREARVPPDVPQYIDAQGGYSYAWALASQIVRTVKMEMMKHG
jgi:hypothetical protein